MAVAQAVAVGQARAVAYGTKQAVGTDAAYRLLTLEWWQFVTSAISPVRQQVLVAAIQCNRGLTAPVARRA